jgi:hypothetical protein
MKPYTDEAWRLPLGLSMSVFGILIALLGISIDMTLTFLALAVLTASTGLIQLSLWSKVRQSWL